MRRGEEVGAGLLHQGKVYLIPSKSGATGEFGQESHDL